MLQSSGIFLWYYTNDNDDDDGDDANNTTKLWLFANNTVRLKLEAVISVVPDRIQKLFVLMIIVMRSESISKKFLFTLMSSYTLNPI